MFPIQPQTIYQLLIVAFTLFSCLIFASALQRRSLWLVATPVGIALVVVGYFVFTTNWHKEYAGLVPIILGSVLGVALSAAFIWAGVVRLILPIRRPVGWPVKLAVTAAPTLIAACFVIWDQTVPSNDCGRSHLDVSLTDGTQIRLFPEFHVSLFQKISPRVARGRYIYSTRTEYKTRRARLCRRSLPIETGVIKVHPSREADAITKTCQSSSKSFCSVIDPVLMRMVSRVEIGQTVVAQDSWIIKDFLMGDTPERQTFGDAQNGALCRTGTRPYADCYVWRDVPNHSRILAVLQPANYDLDPEHIIAMADDAITQILRAMTIPN